jgi:hypothetical protein
VSHYLIVKKINKSICLVMITCGVAHGEKYHNGSTRTFYIFNPHGYVFYRIDATREDGSHGRLVNHSRRNPNACPRLQHFDGQPVLCIFATTDIEKVTPCSFYFTVITSSNISESLNISPTVTLNNLH